MPLKETLTNDIKWLTNERKKLLLSETNLKSKLTTANTNLTNQEKILQEKDNLINNLEEQIKLLTPLKVDISTQTGEWEEGEKLGLTSEDISLMEKKIKTLSHKLILGNIHKNASDYMRRDLTLKVKNLDQLLIETAKERKWLVKNNQEFQEKIQELETILNKKEGDTYQAQVKIRELEELLTEKNEDLSKLPKITQAEFTEVENQLTKFKQKAKDQELEIRGLKAETMSLKQKELAAQNKISDLNLIKSSLESKLSENQILLDSLGKEGIGSQKTIQEQQTKIKLISEDLENIKKQLKIATKERDNYKKESGEKEKELNEITVQLKEKEQELNNLKVKGIGELEGQVKFLEEKSKQEQREKEKLERHAKELREQISDCKIRMDSLVEQAKVQQLIEEINNREVEKQRIKKELEELTKLSKSEKVELENKIISLQNDYQKLKEGENKKITQLEKNVLIKIKKTIEGLTGIEKGTEEESKKKWEMFGKNFAELDSVWKENETTNFKNVLSKTQIISFFNRFKQLVYEVNSLKERLKQGDSNFTQLERTYQEFKNQYETNRKMIEIAENEKGILRTQNEEMVRQKREIENKIRDLESSLNTKERTIQNIRNENQRLNQTVQQKNTEISRLNSDLGVARESRVEKDKIKELESKREGLIKERDNYLNQIRQNESKWKTERDSLNSQINSLSVQISNWKSQSSNYQSQVYNLQNEISSLRSKSIDNLPTITIIRIDEIGIGIDNKTNTHSRFTLNYKNLIEYNKYLSSTGGGIYVGSSFGFKYRFLEIKAKFIRQNNELKWESNTDKVF